MKNFKIGKKLAVTFGVIFLLFCVTVILSVFSLQDSRKNFENFYDSGYQITNHAMDMRRGIQSTIKNLGYAVMTEGQAQLLKNLVGQFKLKGVRSEKTMETVRERGNVQRVPSMQGDKY